MRIENERCQAQCERRNPEVDEVWDPQRDGDIQQHYQCTHAQIDTGTSETQIENAELIARRCKATISSDVTGTTERQVAENRVAVNLRRKHLEHR